MTQTDYIKDIDDDLVGLAPEAQIYLKMLAGEAAGTLAISRAHEAEGGVLTIRTSEYETAEVYRLAAPPPKRVALVRVYEKDRASGEHRYVEQQIVAGAPVERVLAAVAAAYRRGLAEGKGELPDYEKDLAAVEEANRKARTRNDAPPQ